LQEYKIFISDNVHWQHRNEYLSLMTDFLNSKITGVEFEKSFTTLHQENEKIVRKIEFDLEKLKHFPFENSEISPFGLLKGTLQITGDIIGPIEVRWDSNS